MHIKFKGQKLSTLEWVESDSILQGKHCDTKRIFLKTSNKLPKWTECKPETVEQLYLFTKKDLEKAWMHGELRKPTELMHLNNFNEYYKHVYNE
jgi:hypothetical protein